MIQKELLELLFFPKLATFHPFGCEQQLQDLEISPEEHLEAFC